MSARIDRIAYIAFFKRILSRQKKSTSLTALFMQARASDPIHFTSYYCIAMSYHFVSYSKST